MMLGILCLVLAYIAGSFPSGLVIGKALSYGYQGLRQP